MEQPLRFGSVALSVQVGGLIPSLSIVAVDSTSKTVEEMASPTVVLMDEPPGSLGNGFVGIEVFRRLQRHLITNLPEAFRAMSVICSSLKPK